MEQLERIAYMEKAMDALKAALQALSEALGDYEKLRESLRELSTYYSGGLWLRDYADDEAGKLPPDLKRGVLSEDALYDLLSDYDRLLKTMRELCALDKSQPEDKGD